MSNLEPIEENDLDVKDKFVEKSEVIAEADKISS